MKIVKKSVYILTLWWNTWNWAWVSLSTLNDHTQIHHTLSDCSGGVISPKQRPLPDNTEHLQETDFHALSGIRTQNPSSERQQAHALGRVVTGNGCLWKH